MHILCAYGDERVMDINSAYSGTDVDFSNSVPEENVSYSDRDRCF